MPWKIHLSTRLNMYSRRGYDEAAMNTDYLIWNASPFAFFPERPPDGEGGRRGFVAPDAVPFIWT